MQSLPDKDGKKNLFIIKCVEKSFEISTSDKKAKQEWIQGITYLCWLHIRVYTFDCEIFVYPQLSMCSSVFSHPGLHCPHKAGPFLPTPRIQTETQGAEKQDES